MRNSRTNNKEYYARGKKNIANAGVVGATLLLVLL